MTDKLGATGQFPQGKLNEDDEGELQVAIGHDGGKVIIQYGKEVSWVGLDPQGAADFAATILHHARAAARESGQPLTITIG